MVTVDQIVHRPVGWCGVCRRTLRAGANGIAIQLHSGSLVCWQCAQNLARSAISHKP